MKFGLYSADNGDPENIFELGSCLGWFFPEADIERRMLFWEATPGGRGG